MSLSRSLVTLVVGLCAISSSVSAQRSPSLEPCAQLSTLATQNTTFFPADLVLACLQSVPLAKEEGLLQVAGLRIFLEFQSDLVYLQDPTVGRIYPGVDLLTGLDKLTSLLQEDLYTNEYDFQLDVFKLLSSAYDGHLSFVPDIVDVFAFRRLHNLDSYNGQQQPEYFSLFSVITNNSTLPDVYAYDDVMALISPEQHDYNPSSISQINGEDIVTWLNSCASQNGRSQDPDANYNQVLMDIPTLAYQGTETNHFAVSRYYQGNNTVLTFANGTSRDVVTMAQLLSKKGLENLTGGASFFERFCNNDLTETILAQANITQQNVTSQTYENLTQVPYEAISTEGVPPSHPAYPSPIVASSDNSIAGYLSESIPDLAILAIPSFASSAPIEFENVVRQLLATAVDDNRTKLVIDLRGNGGGTIFLAYDLFCQLFPTMTPYGAGNYRASEIHNFTGQLASDNIEQLSTTYPELVQNGVDGVILNSFNYREPLTEDYEHYTSWTDFFGPHEVNGGRFTSINRWNLTDISATTFPIFGYANDNTTQPQSFASEDIVLLYDGTCASTCAIFSEFMRAQMSTRSVTMGGRPQRGPMQGVGGVKGSQVQGMFVLYSIISAVITASPLASQLEFIARFGTNVIEAATQALSRASPGGQLIVQASLNFRNDIRRADDSETPLQHIYEAADCRLFYTPEMYVSQATVWEQAYNSTWGSMECVADSTNHASSVSGGSNITAGPPDTAANFFGGNGTIFLGKPLESAMRTNASTDAGSTSNGNGSQSSNSTNGAQDKESATSILSAPVVLALFTCIMAGALSC